MAVIATAIWVRVSWQEWAILVLTIAMVWMAELANTALEAVVNIVSPDPQPLARIAKDVSAAAVLVGAIAASAIGMIVLGRPLWDRLF